jgi:hypothetical protein
MTHLSHFLIERDQCSELKVYKAAGCVTTCFEREREAHYHYFRPHYRVARERERERERKRERERERESEGEREGPSKKLCTSGTLGALQT